MTTKLPEHATGSIEAPTLQDGRMLTLDILRGVAVALVMFSHLTIAAFPKFAAWDSNRLNFGTIGVCIFFCVSGYVISLSIGNLASAGGSRATATFAIRRLFRLLPPYYVLATILWFSVLPVNVLTQIRADFDRGPVAYVAEFSTLTSYFWSRHTVFRGLEWTLAYEVAFYAACAACISLHRYVARQGLFYALVLVLCAMTLAPPEVTDNKMQNVGLIYLFFILGITAYIRSTKQLSSSGFNVIVIACTAAMLGRLGLWVWRYHALNPMTLASPIALAIFFSLLFFAVSRPRWLGKIGLISYSLYLIHDAVTMAVPLRSLPAWCRPEFWGVIAVGAAYVSHKALERPAIRAGKQLIRLSMRTFPKTKAAKISA